MEWLLGSSTAVGVAGVVVLAYYMVRMARNNRADLQELNQLTRDFADTVRDQDKLRRHIEDLDDALSNRTNERDRERTARRATETLLESALEDLARRPDATGAVASIRRDLRRLSEVLSDPERATPTENRRGGEAVHGETVTDADPDAG
jgi:chromosome segregation ATPase